MICPICHKEFISLYYQSKYCFEQCSHEAQQIKRRVRRQAEKLNRPPVICPICGKSFFPPSGHFKYCPDCKHEAKKAQNRKSYKNRSDKVKDYRRKRYLAHKDEILAKQRAKYRENAAKKGKTVRSRKVNIELRPEYDWRIHRPNLLQNLQNSKPITIPAAVAENRKPTIDELLDAIFKENKS